MGDCISVLHTYILRITHSTFKSCLKGAFVSLLGCLLLLVVDCNLVKLDCGVVMPSVVPLVDCGLVVPLVVSSCLGCVSLEMFLGLLIDDTICSFDLIASFLLA